LILGNFKKYRNGLDCDCGLQWREIEGKWLNLAKIWKIKKPRVNLIQMANLRHTIENKNGIYDKIDLKCIILGTKDLSGINA